MHILEVMENPQKTKHFFQPLKIKEKYYCFSSFQIKNI